MPGERYLHGERIKSLVVSVRKGMRGPQVTLSRSHPNLVRKLFALEVPEIADGTVEIAAIAREAGHRTKIAVRSTVSGVNAKGACIGPMGQRVRNVMTELHGEKIDIVDWADDPAQMVANALSPARVSAVEILDADARSARVVVPDFQLSLAIGKEGQNARLAARLTGWRIDIKSDEARETDQRGSAPRPPGSESPRGVRLDCQQWLALRFLLPALRAGDPSGPASGAGSGPRRASCCGWSPERTRTASPAVVPDPTATAPGRGAHLHPTTACYDLAVRRRAFARALRSGAGLATGPVGEYVAALDRNRIRSEAASTT